MFTEVEANGGPKGKNPYFYVQEFAEPEPTNYNGRRLKTGVTYVIAKYKGSYGTYTLADAVTNGWPWCEDSVGTGKLVSGEQATLVLFR